ncbi:MAG: DUF3662 domain-containing protein [Anaerolineales bacterium]|nr:DUF3662 domain-containing protein [Anaerolineales bacterium]
MDKRLITLERAIRSAIRTSVTRLPWRNFSINTLSNHLAKEILATARSDNEGQSFAPDQYTLSIHPRETGELHGATPEVQREVALDLKGALEKSDFLVTREPHITLATDPTLPRGEVRVIAWHSSDPSEFERPEEPEGMLAPDQPALGAFLVVEGKKHFPLTKPIVTIGRLVDNDLVLDDRHISRRHAQLRAHSGRYKIVDLESTVGTKVNGRLIKEQELKPGDLIKLAKIELIYGEDPGGPPDVTPRYEPTPKPPETRDRPTPLNLKIVRLEDSAEQDPSSPVDRKRPAESGI